MKKYIQNIDESKDYYINLAVEYVKLYDISFDYFLFVNCIIDRAMNVNRGFITLTKDDNYACAIPLMRMMIDNCLRLWGISLVDDTHKYIMTWGKGEKIRSLKDKNGNKLTDKYLSENFGLLYRGVAKTYNDASSFVHLSEQSLYMTAKMGNGERRVNLRVDGYDTFSDEVKCNINKWMLYFNNVLVDLIKSIFPFPKQLEEPTPE